MIAVGPDHSAPATMSPVQPWTTNSPSSGMMPARRPGAGGRGRLRSRPVPSAAVCGSAPAADRWRTTRSGRSSGSQFDAAPGRRSWLPRTRSRSPGHSARSSTKRSSRQASGWATSPRQMTVSLAPTRRLQFRSRCRFISSTLPNGRPQPSSTEGSDRCRSDQSQVRSGALATTGMSASAGRSTSSSTRTFSRTGSMVDSRLLRASKSTRVSLDAQRSVRRASS